MACSDRPSPETAGVNTNPLGYVTQYPSVTSDQSQIQLAKAIGIEQPSLVRTLDQLEEKGLISRQTCASDRRAKRIKLTEKAEPLISEMEAVINKTRAEILHGISAEELEKLIKLIAKLEHNIIELQAKG